MMWLVGLLSASAPGSPYQWRLALPFLLASTFPYRRVWPITLYGSGRRVVWWYSDGGWLLSVLLYGGVCGLLVV